MSTGDILRKGRENAGLSLRKAAARAGVSHVYLLKIEQGSIIPKPWRLSELAYLLGLDAPSVVRAAREEIARRAVERWERP